MPKRVLPVLLVTMVCAGCGQLRSIAQPVVSVQSVHLAQQSEEGVRVEVRLRLENPNDIALPLVAAGYRVQLGGEQFAFSDASNRTLPARGSQELVLPAALATGQRNVRSNPLRVSGWVSYEPPGEVRRVFTESGLPLPRVSFNHDGPLE